MKKTWLYSLVVSALAFGLFPILAHADKVLFFTPTRVVLNDTDKVEVMNITNLSDITRAYKISFQDQVMTYEGYTASVDNFEFSAKRMLRFVPREFTLEPGERQTVRIMTRIRPDTQDGEYHTHVRFLEDVTQRNTLNPPKEGQAASISAPLAYEALIPAIVSHGSIDTRIGLKDAKITKSDQLEKYDVNLILTREGNGQGVALVDTKYVAPGGAITVLTPRRTVYLYREIAERKKDYDFVMPSDLPKGGNVLLTIHDSAVKDGPSVKEVTIPLP